MGQILLCPRVYWPVITAVIALTCVGNCCASMVTFTDGTFDNWMASKILDDTTSGNATFSANQASSGGNPSEFRRVTHSYQAGSIFVGHLFQEASYTPFTQGELLSLDFEYDLVQLNPVPSQAVAYGLLLVQNNTHYLSSTDLIFDGTWTSFSRDGLGSSDFNLLPGSGSAALDFSESGSEIQFGYYSANTSVGTFQFRESGIDNWSVTITTVPEPSIFAMTGFAIFALFFCRSKRSS